MASVDRKLMYAIYDSSRIHTSSSLQSSLVLLPDPKNMRIAFGIPLPSSIEAEILHISYVLPVMLAIFDLPLTLMSESVHTRTSKLLDPENVGVAFGISLLSCVYATI